MSRYLISICTYEIDETHQHLNYQYYPLESDRKAKNKTK